MNDKLRTDRHPGKRAIGFWLLSILYCYWQPSSAVGQIIPDRTLPNNSMVTTEGNLIRIDGGSQAGGNLFHSFYEFSVTPGTAARFNNPVNIENIFTRVTGNNISHIDGLIQANGAANLFLINPNGIVFGSNARLAIGGSFFGSSAESVLFSDGLEFGANLGTVGEPPLLSVNVPIGLQLGANSGSISVNGTGVSEIVPTDNFGLAVAPGQTLALIGNEINFNGGIVTAPSGRIELGSVADGQVGIVQTPVGFQLNYDRVNQLGNIQLSNRSSLFSPAVFDNPISEINVTGNQIILDGSQIVSLTNGNATSGNITVRAGKSLALFGTISSFPFSAWIVNQVAPGATGNSGAINVIAPQVSIENGARIQTLSQGLGAAGNVNVEAELIQINGFALPPVNFDQNSFNNLNSRQIVEQNSSSRISSENLAAGTGGNVTVNTSELTLRAGGQIISLVGSEATGDAGKVAVNANTITAENGISFNPLIFSGIGNYALGMGNGGEIAISTRQLSLSEGAEIFSLNQGSGTGGFLTVNASESIEGRGVNPLLPLIPSGIFASTWGTGDGGGLRVETKELKLSDGAGLTSLVFVRLVGNPISGAGEGSAGDVELLAETIDLVGFNPVNPENSTQLGSITFGSGRGGDVTVFTDRLTIEDGATLISGTLTSLSSFGEPLPGSGTGNGGNLTVNASEAIEIVGENPFIIDSISNIGTVSLGFGNGGDMVVNTPRLIFKAGGVISAGTGGAGDAGRVTINATDILMTGSGTNEVRSGIAADAFRFSESFQTAFFLADTITSNTGEILINAERITIEQLGSITVEHRGIGNAGRLQINATEILLDSGGQILANTGSGFGGNVELNVRDSLQLRNGSAINVETRGDIGDGGNLTINASTIVALENSDIVANAVGGNAGNININTRGIFGTEFRPNLTPESDITASSRLGVDGTVEINLSNIDPISGLL